MKSFVVLLIWPVLGLVLGCGKADREVRLYREITFMAEDAKHPEAPEAPVAMTPGSAMPELPPELRTPSLPLAWETPEGWDVQPASGMRIAAFRVSGQECTILSFPGDVGGDEANIRRWLGQLGVTVRDDALRAFVGSPANLTTVDGHEARVYDFARLLPAESTTSILAAIIPMGDQSVFVKLTGDRNTLTGQAQAFTNLCRSIRLKTEEATRE